jgi:hypothetical protein
LNKELLGWNNHGRVSNDFIIRHHWQESRRKESGEEAEKAKEVGEKERAKKAA